MTKGELLRVLEPFTDDIEIIADLTQEYTRITITRPIVSSGYWLSDDGTGIILLRVGQ